MNNCGNCEYWDTMGFGTNKEAAVGKCEKVARDWFPYSPDKMIALGGTEHCRYPELIAVVTKREFGCNQFEQVKQR